MSKLPSFRTTLEYALRGNLRVEVTNRLRPGSRPRLLPRPMPIRFAYSARRINTLLAAFPGQSRYLEIGVHMGRTLQQIRAPERWGVEPHPYFRTDRLPKGVTIRKCTSDEFFATLDAGQRFDVVFLDGLHTFQQTYRDLINALRVCPSGLVLIDDVVPVDSVSANPDQREALEERARRHLQDPTFWHGDVYRVVVALSEHHSSQLTFCTIVGSGNPQTLVWRKSVTEEILPANQTALAGIEKLTYDDVFHSGVPDSFVPRSEDSAMDWALGDLHRL